MTYKVQIDNVVREATETEITAIEAAQNDAAQQLEAKQAAEKNRQNALAKLEALGLTPAEIAALVGA